MLRTQAAGGRSSPSTTLTLIAMAFSATAMGHGGNFLLIGHVNDYLASVSKQIRSHIFHWPQHALQLN
ncbi:hypothetical protein STEG23_019005 [Scotinomys teguina]